MKKDSFLRCYLEAWIYWIALNLVGACVGWLTNDQFGFPTIPPSQFELLLQPGALIAQGIFIIALFAAILVGSRRSTGRVQ